MAKKKKSNGIMIKAILALAAVFLVVLLLDLWAMSKINIDTSQESMASLISGSSLEADIETTKIITSVRLNNPSILPVYASSLEYNLEYGEMQVANGTTKGFYIAPKSNKEVPAELYIDNVNAAKAALSGIAGLFGGKTEDLAAEYKVSIGPIKMSLTKAGQQ